MQSMIATIADFIEAKDFGGKAHGLSWLYQQGYPVPYAIFLRAFGKNDTESKIDTLFDNRDFLERLETFSQLKDLYDVAVRSSGTLEDKKVESLAGHFKSYVGTVDIQNLKNNVKKVIDSLDKSNTELQKMGVVIQQMITPLYSGVIFSSNPLSGSKIETIVSLIEGFGDSLVSGKKSGEDIIISQDEEKISLSAYSTNIEESDLINLYKLAKEIEQKLNYPVDIEWCIDSKTNKIFLLQCRPLTGFRLDYLGVVEISLENKSRIPSLVLNNDKIRLRLISEENNIKMSKAYLVVLSCTEKDIFIDLLEVGKDENCKGYSVVLLHPKTISGKIIRAFAKKELEKQRNIFRTCQRYNVRQYVDFTDLESNINSIADQCFEVSWNCVAIIQEIFEPEYTGIVKKIADGYVVELARGHFVPKGIVTTSQYVLNSSMEITFSNEALQKMSYTIINGQVLEEEINEKLTVPKNIVELIVNTLYPLLKDQDKAIEFGLLRQRDNTIVPYLIDLVEDKSKIDLSTNLILEGVISSGNISGEVNIIQSEDINGDSLHLHYHNQIQENFQISENIIFICPSPDIALLSLLEKYDNSKIGFIFREGSTLSHLSIVLRERGIPAILLNDGHSLQEGDLINLDAITMGLQPLERVKIRK